MILTDNIKKEIAEICDKNPEVESGGLIVESIDSELSNNFVVKCKNVSTSPKNSFFINVEEWLEIEKSNKILGVFHSHNEDKLEFSEADIYMSEKKNLVSIIYNTKNGDFKIYSPKKIKIPYVGRPFYPCVLDCVTLVIDYYKKEFNIEIGELFHVARFLPDMPRKAKWLKSVNQEGVRDLEEYYEKNGFVEIDKKSKLKVGDLVLSPCVEYMLPASHVAIYLGNGLVLHHPDTGSEYAYFAAEYKTKKSITSVMRHKNFI